MSDQEVITLDSDDDESDLIGGQTGTAVLISEAAIRGMPRLPLPPGI